MVPEIITLNVVAEYSGYNISFEVNRSKYNMKPTCGNRGTMNIFLISINASDQTYNWRYMEKEETYIGSYTSITKV